MNYIISFRQSIKKADIKKAKKLLSKLNSETDETKFEVINELALAPDDIAWDLLFYLIKLKIHDQNIYDHIIQLVLDRAHLNFKFAIILYRTGNINKIQGIVALMRHILIRTTDPVIISETIVTAGQEKIESLVDDIAEYIYYDNPELKAVAVEALMQIGSESAVQRLMQASKTTKCDKSILNAIDVLKIQKESLKRQGSIKKYAMEASEKKRFLSLNTQIKSKNLDIRFKAVNDIIEIIKAVLPLQEENFSNSALKKDHLPNNSLIKEYAFTMAGNLKSDNYDLKINTLRIIAKTVQKRFVPDICELLDKNHINPGIKFTAFETFSAFHELDSASVVVNGLDDPVMYVRMAAAKVLNKNASDFICAEIKDRIESGREAGAMIARTIIDVKAENLINSLMASDTFSYIASNYLRGQAPSESLKKYIYILQKRGLKSTAKKFEALLMNRKNNTRSSVMVISSSSSVQDFYEKLLYTKGYASIPYTSCQDAFEELLNKKPAFVLCDLFLDTMTGIDFAREVREFYSKDKLPIIITSRQKDFTADSLEKEYKIAGINAVRAFPAVIPVNI